MTIKTIKGVDEDTWYRFRSLAVKSRIGMGNLLNEMIKEYENKSKEFWNDILESEKLLSDKEADELLNRMKKLRKEYGFRQ